MKVTPFRRGRRAVRGSALLAAGLLLVAACGDDGEDAASSAEEDAAAEDTAAEEESGSGEEEDMGEPEGATEFTVAFTTPGVSSVPLLEAIDQLNQEGYNIEAPTVGSSELAVDGVFRGQFQFSSGASNAVFLANQQGGNIQIVSNRVDNEWTVYAANDIEECADLEGQRLAIHSEGAVSAAMVRNYIEVNCPGTEPEYLVIEGSQNRLAAMLADEIDASPIELADAIIVENEAADRYHLLASLAETLPDLKPTAVYANGDFAAENPGSVQALVRAQLEVHRQIAGNPEYLAEIVLKHIPETDQETLDQVTQRYVEQEMFGLNGGLTEEGLQYTLDFFVDAIDDLESGLTVDDVSDLSHLGAVLSEIGEQCA